AEVLDEIESELPAGASAGATPLTELEDATGRVGRARESAREAALASFMASRTASAHVVEDGLVRLLIRTGSRVPAGLGVRFPLHRTTSYPLAVVAIGAAEDGEPIAHFFDVDRAEDRQALALLGPSFHIVL